MMSSLCRVVLCCVVVAEPAADPLAFTQSATNSLMSALNIQLHEHTVQEAEARSCMHAHVYTEECRRHDHTFVCMCVGLTAALIISTIRASLMFFLPHMMNNSIEKRQLYIQSYGLNYVGT